VYSLAPSVPPHRLLHVSDLHVGRRETPGVSDGLGLLAAELQPEILLATGDFAHRGRRAELEQARRTLDALGLPLVAVPGNHDIPYTFPARFTRTWREWERSFGPENELYRSETLVVAGLNSVRPWRHQSGRLSDTQLERARTALRDKPPGALAVAACHHHLGGSPWRAARKRPLARRDAALAALVAAGVEVVAGGHIHQASIAERKEFEALAGPPSGSAVVATAPGLGRPRPYRRGEAQGLLSYEWDEHSLVIVTYVWHDDRFLAIARRTFPRSGSL
jgi:3',5'-cyclic AMP phosphodiesterase CpdA